MTIKHDCSEELRQARLAVTPARIAALRFFEKYEKPLDALSLVENLSQKNVDRVTAFRTLNAFVQKRLLRKVEFGDRKTRYELTSRGDHHHFVCLVCRKIIDIGKDTVMHSYIEKTERKFGFHIADHSLEFFGTCSDCLRRGKN